MKKILTLILIFCIAFTSLPGFGTTVMAADQGEDVMIDAEDYGVDPSGKTDSTRSIQAALAAAKQAKEDGAAHVTLSFPKGEYHIYKDYAEKREYHTSNTNSIENPTKTIGILIEEQEDLTIDGNDSLFMMHGNMMALAVVHSKNITLENFAWDFAVPTVSEMTITEFGTEDGRPYTDFSIPECCPYEIQGTTIRWNSEPSPYTGKYYWQETGIHRAYSIVATHPDDEMTRAYVTSDSPFSGVNSIRALDNGTGIRIVYHSTRPAMQRVGMIMEFASSIHRETAGAFTWESENVTARNIDVHFMHGFGWLIQMSRDIYYYNCDLMPREGSGHQTVSYADGIHASGSAGDLVIQDCNFSNTHDDPINLHGTFTRVEQRVDDHTLTLRYIHAQQGGFPQFHVGDKVSFFTRDTLESTDREMQYTVEEVLEQPGDNGDWRNMKVRFVESLPANLADRISNEPKYVAENVTYTPKVTIKGCTFRNVPTRGILCTTRQPVLIENNTFYNMSMATIYLSNDSATWYESGPIRDMTIRGNTFYIKSIGRTSWEYAPAVYVNPITKGGGLPSVDNPIHKNITIEENTFYMDTDTVVKAESVENLTIRNNKIMRANPVSIAIEASWTQEDGTVRLLEGNAMKVKVDAQWKRYTLPTENVYEFTKCKNVVLEGNTYDDGLKLYAVLSNMEDTYLTNRDPDIQIVRDRNQPASDPVGEIQFVSSDPETLSVDQNGRMTGLKPGTATVYAYFAWNDTQILSNQIEVTIVGKSDVDPADVVTIQDMDQDAVLTTRNETLTFSASTPSNKTIIWTVEDFLTGGATDAASISSDGTVTALGNGIVWVRASAGVSTACKALIISIPETGNLSPDFTIMREDKSNYILASDQVIVDMQKGDLYQQDNTVKNLFLYSAPEQIGTESLRTVLKVDNLPIKENLQWDTASFILYQDDDNYITVGKKSHFDGISTVREVQGNAVETGGNADQNQLSSAWLGFYKNGNTVSVDFKTDDGTWQHVRDLNADMLRDNFKIGFTAWESNSRGKTATFSEFRVGAGSVSYEDLCEQPAISFTEPENQAPVAEEVTFDKDSYNIGDTATVQYVYSDPDQDEEGDTRFCFILANGAQIVTDTPSLTVTAPGEISCQVYVVDKKGRPSTSAVTANAMVIDQQLSDAKADLETEIVKAEAIDLSEYTQESVNEFQDALKSAQEYAGKEDASLQDLQDALQRLQSAINNLQKKEPPKPDDPSPKPDDPSPKPDDPSPKPDDPSPKPDVPSPKPDVPSPKPDVKAIPKKGTVFTYNGIQYRVTKSAAKNGTVAVVKRKGKQKTKLVIPDKVTKDGYSFKVTAIKKSAFANYKTLKTLVIGKNIKTIGAKAFQGCICLKKIQFKGKNAPKISGKAFQKIAADCKIIVSRKMSAKQLQKLKKQMKSAGLKQGKYVRL